MDVTEILEPLNDAQREAVTAPAGHMLVLAGAGSGKTRVLVHRIAWLLATREATPFGILAVTFTNKAASEMRNRIESMLGRPAGGMWVGTFHGLAHRLLRAHWRDAGLREDFQILDSEDQLRCIRRAMRDLDLDEQRWPPKQAQGFINARKDEGLRAEHLERPADLWMERMVRIYATYQETCERTGVVDFAELLLRCHELFRDRDDVLAHYRARFRHVLVDEFQDTNTIQYAWLRLLAGSEGHLCCVGDDDQSVYGWRGARIENILQFPRDFADVATVRLERNYRSSGNILAAANALIANNQGRMGKNLWTEDGDGEPIDVYAGFNDIDEARFIVSRIRQWVEVGGRRDDIAILYRVSAQSRVLEEALLAQGVAYRVYGGLRFYERAEIRNALAYCRLSSQSWTTTPRSNGSSTCRRSGIGARTDGRPANRSEPERRRIALGRDAAVTIDENTAPRAPARRRRCRGFLDLIRRARERPRGASTLQELSRVRPSEASGLLDYYRAGEGRSRPDAGREPPGARHRRRDSSISTAKTDGRETPMPPATGPARGTEDRPTKRTGIRLTPLTAFLSHAALETGEEQAAEESGDLRQPHDPARREGARIPRRLPVSGMEEGLFPHSRSTEDPGPSSRRSEASVLRRHDPRGSASSAMTYAESRRLHGRPDRYSTPSRFLRELPPDRVEEVRLRGTVARPGTRFRSRTPPSLRRLAPIRDEPGTACASDSASSTRSSARAWC